MTYGSEGCTHAFDDAIIMKLMQHVVSQLNFPYVSYFLVI